MPSSSVLPLSVKMYSIHSNSLKIVGFNLLKTSVYLFQRHSLVAQWFENLENKLISC